MLIERMGLPRDALSGKVAVVTGAGRGIGKELALALAWLGAKVVVAEISKDGAEVETQIRGSGGDALFVQTDLGDQRSVLAMAQKVLERYGGVDILVNNAAAVHTGSLLELPIEAWDHTYAVNIRGVVLATRSFLPGMLERRDGVVVMVASAEGIAYQAPYSFTKVGQQSIGISLSQEIGPDSGVSVFVFAPGMVDTPAIDEYVHDLALRYGMTFEEFTHMGANPGYDGLMPAEDCAAGFAYNIVHAKELHGQIADAFQPLARLGLLNLAGNEAVAQLESAEAAAPAGADAPALAAEVLAVLQTVDREYEELDIFRKGWVTRDFQKHTGMSVKDWLQAASILVGELEALAAGASAADAARIRGKFPWLKERLGRLANFFQKNQKDARGYIRDPQQLALALEALEKREAAARGLIDALG